jgi:two-component system chemotaxis response regulator CheB
MASDKITVLIVDDSPIAILLLKRILARAADIEVVGSAQDGREGLRLIDQLNPQVVCTDLHMPVMDGLELTRAIMRAFPRPVLVVSVSVYKDSPSAFRLLEAGALDVVAKPRQENEVNFQDIAAELISKVRILAGVKVFRHARPERTLASPTLALQALDGLAAPVKVVTVGASTGGPPVLQTILSHLPRDFSLPVVVVQHISKGFLSNLVSWLGGSCSLRVSIAQAGELPYGGGVYFAPEGKHQMFDREGRFVLSSSPPVLGHRPSVTQTMRSAVACHGAGVAGLLLTGMGNDGAEGMLDIARAGGMTIAQDERSCVVFGMPKQAISLGAVKLVLPLEAITDCLIRLQGKVLHFGG